MNIRNVLLTILIIFTPFQYAVANQEKQLTHSSRISINQILHKLGYAKISIFKKDGAFYANGTVGNQPVNFLLDNGSVEASILADGVKQLNLKPIQTDEKSANMTGAVNFAQKVKITRVNIGNFRVKDFLAKLTSQPFKNNLPTVILGNDFFSKYNAIINIDQGFIYLKQNKISKKNQYELKQYLTEAHYQSIPLTRLNSGHFTLPIQVNTAAPVY